MLLVVLCLLSVTQAAAADQTPQCVRVQRGAFGVVEDASIQEALPGRTAGDLPTLRTGFSGRREWRALYRFELGFLPTDAFVVSAVFTTRISSSGAQAISAHRVTAAWTEAAAMWDGVAAHHSSEVEDLFFGATRGTASLELTGLVQGWVDGTYDNHGFMLEEAPMARTLYESSECPDVDSRPALDVCYIVNSCGDGVIGGSEICDDGNAAGGDGCGADCATENGFACGGAPSVCVTSCGDGIVAGAEECDDRNSTAGDGCSAACAVERGYTCGGAPSVCACAGGTPCDDGNACTLNDACSAGVCSGDPLLCPRPGECQMGGTCDPAGGSCTYTPRPDGTACSTGTCFAGRCTSARLEVEVLDKTGAPVVAKVYVGTNSAVTTDASGKAIFDGLTPGDFVARIDATGYAPAAVHVELRPDASTSSVVHLLRLGEPTPFHISTGVDVVTDTVRVIIPADALEAPNNRPVTGTAQITIAPLDPTTDLDMMPGPLVGLSPGATEPAPLISVFMADITITQRSQKLQLKPGHAARIEFVLPDAQQAMFAPGDVIPAWYFDLHQGLWIQEGEGVIQPSSADPGKLAWHVDVNHFTWWNADFVPSNFNCIRVRTIDAETDKEIPDATVVAASLGYRNYRYSRVTDGSGETCLSVPGNDLTEIRAEHKDYQGVAGEYPVVLGNTSNAQCGSSACTIVQVPLARSTCLTGIVTDEFDSVVEDASITAWYRRATGPATSQALTNVDGRYCIDAPMNAQVTIEARKNNQMNGTSARAHEVFVPELTCDANIEDTYEACTVVDDIALQTYVTLGSDWAARIADDATDDPTQPPQAQEATDVAVDVYGNVFVTGNFGGRVNIGGTVLTSTGEMDIFVAKFGPNGNLLRATSFGDGSPLNISDHRATAMALDSGGNVVLVGSYTGRVTFGATTLTSVDSWDGFVVRLSGVDLRASLPRNLGGTGEQWPRDVVFDRSNPTYPEAIVVVGDFNSQIDCSGGMRDSYCPATHMKDIFVTKLFSPTAYVWTEVYGGTGDQQVSGAAMDAGGNLILTGKFSGALSFPGWPLTANDVDAFVAKLDIPSDPSQSVAVSWARRFGLAGDQRGAAVVADLSGDVWFTGDYAGTIELGSKQYTSAGQTDAFVAKLRRDNGNVSFSDDILNSNIQHGADIKVDTDGGLLIAGTVRGNVHFGGKESEAIGQEDLYIAKLDSDGDYLWFARYGGDSSSYILSPSIAVRPSDPSGPNHGTLAVSASLRGGFDLGGEVGEVPASGENDTNGLLMQFLVPMQLNP
ncbi:DNRLRE domain-containing protein [Sorangium sp. So ce1667]